MAKITTVTSSPSRAIVHSDCSVYIPDPSPSSTTTLRSGQATAAPVAIGRPKPIGPAGHRQPVMPARASRSPACTGGRRGDALVHDDRLLGQQRRDRLRDPVQPHRTRGQGRQVERLERRLGQIARGHAQLLGKAPQRPFVIHRRGPHKLDHPAIGVLGQAGLARIGEEPGGARGAAQHQRRHVRQDPQVVLDPVGQPLDPHRPRAAPDARRRNRARSAGTPRPWQPSRPAAPGRHAARDGRPTAPRRGLRARGRRRRSRCRTAMRRRAPAARSSAPPASVQAVLAGRISVAICPFLARAARTASAPSRGHLRGIAPTPASSATPPARSPTVSPFSGAS